MDMCLENQSLVMSPVVLAELLSDQAFQPEHEKYLLQLPSLELKPLFWMRAGKMRAKLRAKELKAKLADTLIAQLCIDHEVPLITRDRDFSHFQKFCGLKLL
jgi:predicted nucleic acid-binding protein